jgi:hypothetical protein
MPRTRVPHISRAFREMWGATVGRPFDHLDGYQSQCSAIPHLVKNVRGMGPYHIRDVSNLASLDSFSQQPVVQFAALLASDRSPRRK